MRQRIHKADMDRPPWFHPEDKAGKQRLGHQLRETRGEQGFTEDTGTTLRAAVVFNNYKRVQPAMHRETFSSFRTAVNTKKESDRFSPAVGQVNTRQLP